MAPQFGEDAIRAQGEGYQQQLEHMLPTEADRERYEELSKKPTTELSAAEAQHVADIRNQIPVGGDQIVTKVLSQGALDGYLNDDPSKQWQGVQGSIARGVDVVDMNNPKGLRDGLALDDGMGDKGWSPIKENQPEAYQMRWKPGDTVDDLFVPYGGPQKDTYASPAEQAHYDASAQQMASAGGTATETRMQAPFTGSGSTGGGVPEWQAPRGSSLGQRAEIWQLNADGSPERLHAVYESGLGWKKA
jgi:hypothetical protein